MKHRTWQQSTDPRALLAHVGGAATVRRLRLFACACCRRGWHFAKDKRLEPLLLLLEEFADGTAKEARREPARERSYLITKADVSDSEHCLAWEIWGALRPAFDPRDSDLGESAAAAFGYKAGNGPEFYPAKQAERERQAVLVREIFGDPFRTVAADPAWRTDTARTLATPFARPTATPPGGTGTRGSPSPSG